MFLVYTLSTDILLTIMANSVYSNMCAGLCGSGKKLLNLKINRNQILQKCYVLELGGARDKTSVV